MYGIYCDTAEEKAISGGCGVPGKSAGAASGCTITENYPDYAGGKWGWYCGVSTECGGVQMWVKVMCCK